MSINPEPSCIPDRTVNLYNEIGSYERHFNGIQNDYRKLAAQLLIAAFTAIWIVIA